MSYRSLLVLSAALALFAGGCGAGSNSSRTSTTSPSASTPSSTPPSTTPTAAPPPANPAPTTPTASTPDSYLATISSTAGKNPVSAGTVSIDTTANNGAGTLQINGMGFSNAELQFCPSGVNGNCINVVAVSTNANGTATVNFMFPEKGTFAGDWNIVTSNCSSGCQIAASSTGDSGVNFTAAMLPASTISGGIGQATGSAAGSGTISVNNTTAHLTLSGTTPSHTFNVAVCAAPQQSNCATLSSVTTDASGNASADVGTVQPFGWSVFEVSDGSGVEFISAFRVQ